MACPTRVRACPTRVGVRHGYGTHIGVSVLHRWTSLGPIKCNEKCKLLKIIKKTYHLVRDTIRKPRNTVSSSSGARTPVMPTKQAVLQEIWGD